MRIRARTPSLVRWASTSPAAAASTSTSYTPPLAPSRLAAYDAAVAYLAQDKATKLQQLTALKKDKSVSQHELEDLETAAWVNDPETRWRAEQGKGDMKKPVYRHLAERAWRKDGPLALVMQRVTQMNVTPDLLPSISPAVDLQVKLNHQSAPLEAGVFVQPAETREGAQITAQVYHEEERLYTLLMIDPDVPDETTRSFTTYAHWLQTNIPLSSISSELALSSSSSPLPFVPPHPQLGTPYHRYTFLLFQQPSGPLKEDALLTEREAFDTRAFVKRHELDPVGVTFFRQTWTDDVSKIYTEVLGREEPRYAKYKAPEPYKRLKEMRGGSLKFGQQPAFEE